MKFVDKRANSVHRVHPNVTPNGVTSHFEFSEQIDVTAGIFYNGSSTLNYDAISPHHVVFKFIPPIGSLIEALPRTDNDNDFPLRIVSRDVAQAVYRNAKYIISINGSTEDPPDFEHDNILSLHFDDIRYLIPGYEAVNKCHVKAIVAFSNTIKNDPAPVLVHCSQGISRSSATALVLLNVLAGPGQEKKIFHKLKSNNPHIKPNVRLITLADLILDRQGELLKSVNN